MSRTGADAPAALAQELSRAIGGRDAAAFAALWPPTGAAYAHNYFSRLLKGLPAGALPPETAVLPAGEDYGLIRVRLNGAEGAEIGYCRVGGELRLVWKYAVSRLGVIAGWRSAQTRHYQVYLSPGLAGERDLSVLDAATGRVTSYFSLRAPAAPGKFIHLSRKDELGAAAPGFLSKCDYVDPVTGDIVSTVLEDYHEITHRVFLFNGFPCGAPTLLQEGSAEILNPSPYEPEEKIELTPDLVRSLLDDARFYSDRKNFSRAAKFCDGAIQLLGMERFRELYGTPGRDLLPLLEKYAGCPLGEFLRRITHDTRLPGRG